MAKMNERRKLIRNLYVAIERGDIATVRACIDQQNGCWFSLDESDYILSAVLLLCKSNTEEIVELLLKTNLATFWKCFNETALLSVIRLGKLSICRLLVEMGKMSVGHRELLAAVEFDRGQQTVDIITFLLKHSDQQIVNVNDDEKCVYGGTVLQRAIEFCNLSAVRTLLEVKNVKLGIQCPGNGETALHTAARIPCRNIDDERSVKALEIVNRILDRDESIVNEVTKPYAQTALHVAAIGCKVHMVRALLYAGAVQQPNKADKTPEDFVKQQPPSIERDRCLQLLQQFKEKQMPKKPTVADAATEPACDVMEPVEPGTDVGVQVVNHESQIPRAASPASAVSTADFSIVPTMNSIESVEKTTASASEVLQRDNASSFCCVSEVTLSSSKPSVLPATLTRSPADASQVHDTLRHVIADNIDMFEQQLNVFKVLPFLYKTGILQKVEAKEILKSADALQLIFELIGRGPPSLEMLHAAIEVHHPQLAALTRPAVRIEDRGKQETGIIEKEPQE